MSNMVQLWSRIGSRAVLGTLASALVVAFAGPRTSFAQRTSYTILYSFQCGTDGNQPYGGLTRDSSGNLYGTTGVGGAFGLGTVFEISAGGQETILHDFGGGPTDGASPVAALVRDGAGNLYGTTQLGGAFGFGTVFKLSAKGAERVLHSFGGTVTDGQYPDAGLILDPAGNLYGTTAKGGFNAAGTVFEVTQQGKETVLHTFNGSSTDGGTPLGGLVRDTAGNLYGATELGGTFGVGTVFEVTAEDKEIVLYSFGATATDGGQPIAGLLRDQAGNLYGTTEGGGAFGFGTVFKLDPTGEETLLFSFDGFPAGDNGGYDPVAGLVEDGRGNFYGTTFGGGSSLCSGDGCGVVFELSPAGQEKVLHSFSGFPADGQEPYAGLIRDGAGNLYGTTISGGTGAGCGTVFKIAP